MPSVRKGIFIVSLFTFVGMFISACSDQNASSLDNNKVAGRWYSDNQVSAGEKTYNKNCMVCHLKNAVGTTDWKKTLEDGSYPPPPLNGSAHAWHHSIEVLMNVVQEGGTNYGGKMPPFKDVLTEQEQRAVIAYFQSFWSDEIYSRWQKISEQN